LTRDKIMRLFSVENWPLLALLLIPIFYLATLAQGLVLGDPSEYTLVAHVLGIAHPPGYAFITLLGKLFQTLIPFGEIPWRMHLMSAAAGTASALFVFGAITTICSTSDSAQPYGRLASLFGALTVASAVNFWQHAIHANPHIITATFLAANVYLLTKWWAAEARERQGDKEVRRKGDSSSPYLLAFAFLAGLGVTHHPLTVFSFPAYGLFIVWLRPSILWDWRTLLKMVALALLGLAVWLYFPVRSPMQPVFGPPDMNSWEGFRRVVLAEGLRVNLFQFGLIDQGLRAQVFSSLLRLQYSLPTVFLALLGVGYLSRATSATSKRPLLILYVGAFLCNYLFVINTVQDVMAYLLGPFLLVGLLAGVGLWGFIRLLATRVPAAAGTRLLLMLLVGLFLLGPLLQVGRNLPRVSLRGYDEGDVYVAAVFDWFDGRGEAAVLLNDWERMTPLWYTRSVNGRWPDPADVRPEFVAADRTWLALVFDYLPGGPVYFNSYQPEVVRAGFRLRARGPFYQVVEPGDASLPPELMPVSAVGGDLELVGYNLSLTEVTAGDYVPLVLAFRASQGTADYYVPVVYVGDIVFAFTTDSHLITPLWQPGEVIVERFNFALPHDLANGRYPVRVNLKNLSSNIEYELNLPLGDLVVSGQAYPVTTQLLLANFRQQVGLAGATARHGWQRRVAPWGDRALTVRPGDTVNVTLGWQALARPGDSYTVFVHLIDAGNYPWVDNLDYTPLGGAAPTHLWIPKWLPGQRYTDPYRMQIPPDLAPGNYWIEVGLYEMRSGRRLHMHDAAGSIIGDRYILGKLIVSGD